MTENTYTGVIFRLNEGISKKGNEYRLVELFIVELSAKATAFIEDVALYNKLAQGNLVEVTLDTSSPMEPQIVVLGVKHARLEVVPVK